VNDRPSTLGARTSGPRAGRRFDADLGVTTEALIFLGDLDPEAIGPNIVHATHYEPTPVGELAPLLELVPIALAGTTFIDLGAGMGRALMLAARLPFRQAIGVEISPALCEVARENLAKLPRDGLRCRDLRIVRADAAAYRFPRGDLIVYLYNPFDGAVLADVLDRLARDATGDVALVYHTPVAREVVEAHACFELAAESATGAVYRLAASSRASPGARS
jgi:SAM-dependent methyltransferase